LRRFAKAAARQEPVARSWEQLGHYPAGAQGFLIAQRFAFRVISIRAAIMRRRDAVRFGHTLSSPNTQVLPSCKQNHPAASIVPNSEFNLVNANLVAPAGCEFIYSATAARLH
jgi:hypothetical protein